MRLSLAHSPDSDDAFMFYGLARGKVPTDGLEIAHVLRDIETLNQQARDGVHEVTAVSFHAYAHVGDRYALMPCGGSIGDGYGPLLVAGEQKIGDEIEAVVDGRHRNRQSYYSHLQGLGTRDCGLNAVGIRDESLLLYAYSAAFDTAATS